VVCFLSPFFFFEEGMVLLKELPLRGGIGVCRVYNVRKKVGILKVRRETNLIVFFRSFFWREKKIWRRQNSQK